MFVAEEKWEPSKVAAKLRSSMAQICTLDCRMKSFVRVASFGDLEEDIECWCPGTLNRKCLISRALVLNSCF